MRADEKRIVAWNAAIAQMTGYDNALSRSPPGWEIDTAI